MTYALDSSAVIAYLQGEEGADLVDGILRDENEECFIHALNSCEVFYDLIRRSSIEEASEVFSNFLDTGVLIVEDMDFELWMMASALKSEHKLSLADCFCIALAYRVEGTILTSDHHEFEPIEGIIEPPIIFIRPEPINKKKRLDEEPLHLNMKWGLTIAGLPTILTELNSILPYAPDGTETKSLIEGMIKEITRLKKGLDPHVKSLRERLQQSYEDSIEVFTPEIISKHPAGHTIQKIQETLRSSLEADDDELLVKSDEVSALLSRLNEFDND